MKKYNNEENDLKIPTGLLDEQMINLAIWKSNLRGYLSIIEQIERLPDGKVIYQKSGKDKLRVMKLNEYNKLLSSQKEGEAVFNANAIPENRY